MINGSKFRDYAGAVDTFLNKCFKDTELERQYSPENGLTVRDHFKLNARTAFFVLKQQAETEKSASLQALVPLINRRMEKVFDT